MRKTAIVTDGAQGIGRAITTDLVGCGWSVACVDRDAEASVELSGAYSPDTLIALNCDVADEAQVKRAFARYDTWLRRHDIKPGLDLRVNNAGLADPHSGPIEKLSLATGNAGSTATRPARSCARGSRYRACASDRAAASST